MEGPLWFHCSRCYRDASASQHPVASFHITSCSHLLCGACYREAAMPKDARECPVCLGACSMLPLNAQMPPELRKVFADPAELAQDLLQTCQFQRAHQDRLMHYLRDIVRTQRDVLQRARADLVAAREQHADMIRLRQENERLQQQVLYLQQQSQQPQGGAGSSLFQSRSATTTAGAAATGDHPFLFSSSTRARLNTTSAPPPAPETPDSHFPARVPSTPLGPSRLTLRTPPMSGRIQPPSEALLPRQQASTWASTYDEAMAVPRRRSVFPSSSSSSPAPAPAHRPSHLRG